MVNNLNLQLLQTNRGQRGQQLGEAFSGGIQKGLKGNRLNNFRKTFRDEYASGSPDRNKILSAYGNYDPEKAMQYQQKEGSITPNLQAKMETSANAEALGERIRQAEAEYRNAKENGAPEKELLSRMVKIRDLIQQYNQISKRPYASSVIDARKDERLDKVEDDRDRKDLELFIAKRLQSVRTHISTYRGAKQTLDNLGTALLGSIRRDGKTGSPIMDKGKYIASPISELAVSKISIQKIDDSIVMPSEAKTGNSQQWLNQLKGWWGKYINGESITRSDFTAYWENYMNMVRSINTALDKIEKGDIAGINNMGDLLQFDIPTMKSEAGKTALGKMVTSEVNSARPMTAEPHPTHTGAWMLGGTLFTGSMTQGEDGSYVESAPQSASTEPIKEKKLGESQPIIVPAGEKKATPAQIKLREERLKEMEAIRKRDGGGQ